MTRKQNENRLTGAQFEPRRTRRQKLGGEVRQQFADRLRGRQVGSTEQFDVDFQGDNQQLPARALIDEELSQEKADIEYAFEQPRDNAQKVYDDARLEKRHAERHITKVLEPKQQKAKKELAELGHRDGTSLLALVLAGLLALLANLGVDYGAATAIPAPPLFQWLIVLGLGLATVWIAHLAGNHLAQVIEVYPRRKTEPVLYRKEIAGLVLTTVVPAVAMVAFTAMRASNYEYIARVTGIGADGINIGAINLGLLALAIVTFLIAVLAAFRYERFKPVREKLRELAAIEREITAFQAIADRAERTMQLAINTIAYLKERKQRTLEAAEAHARQRHNRLEHARRRAATRLAVKDRRAVRKGRRSAVLPSENTTPDAPALTREAEIDRNGKR